MQRRLTREERESIEELFEGNVIYQLVADAARHRAASARVLRLSPEEAMVEVAEQLDNLKEKPAEAAYLCRTAWDGVWYDIRQMDDTAPDEDVEEAVALVLELLAALLSLAASRRHHAWSLHLLAALNEHVSCKSSSQEEWMAPLVWRLGDDCLKNQIEAYWQSDKFLSDTIYDALHADTGTTKPTEGKASSFRIVKGQKTNFAKIISAMFDLRMFEDDKGQIASNKQKLMDELGTLFGTEFKNLPQLLNAGKQGASYTEVFDRLKEKAEKYDIK